MKNGETHDGLPDRYMTEKEEKKARKEKGERGKRLTPKALNLGLSGGGAPPEPKLKAPGRRYGTPIEGNDSLGYRSFRLRHFHMDFKPSVGANFETCAGALLQRE